MADTHLNISNVTKTDLMSVKMTFTQLHLMLHCLGLERSSSIYRNYFFADCGHVDFENLELLVKKGYMHKRPSPISKDFVYVVTSKGIQALKKLGLKIQYQ